MGRPHSPWLQNVLAILPWAAISWKFSRNKKGYKKILILKLIRFKMCIYVHIYILIYRSLPVLFKVSDALRYESSFQELHRG